MSRQITLIILLIALVATPVLADTATVTCQAPNGGFTIDGTNFTVLVFGETGTFEVRDGGSLFQLWTCGWPDGCKWLSYTVMPGSTWEIVNVGGAMIIMQTPDWDGDGISPPADCDDSNANIYPGATELCDELDNDCDTILPDDETDIDGDGYIGCQECNDLDAAVNPDAMELPGNSIDENCDGDLGDCNPCFPWRNHGEYVRCVAHAVEALVADGDLSEEEGDVLVVSAATSDVGKKNYTPPECN